jgi:hypothetical protein
MKYNYNIIMEKLLHRGVKCGDTGKQTMEGVSKI